MCDFEDMDLNQVHPIRHKDKDHEWIEPVVYKDKLKENGIEVEEPKTTGEAGDCR